MIISFRSFRDHHTEEFWRHGTGKSVPPDLRRVAMRKLKLLDDAAALADLRVPPGNHLEELKGIGPANTAFASTGNIVFALSGAMETRTRLKLSTTTEAA